MKFKKKKSRSYVVNIVYISPSDPQQEQHQPNLSHLGLLLTYGEVAEIR